MEECLLVKVSFLPRKGDFCGENSDKKIVVRQFWGKKKKIVGRETKIILMVLSRLIHNL